MTLCISVVEGMKTVPLLLANTASKTITIKQGEELGYACPRKSIKQMRVIKNYGRKIETSSLKIKEKDLIVPERYKDEIKRLLKFYRDVVANTDKELGQTGTAQMKIETGDHPPIKMRPYRTSIHKRKLVEEAVNEMLDSGIILVPMAVPLLLIDDILALLGKSTCFSTLDLRLGYILIVK